MLGIPTDAVPFLALFVTFLGFAAALGIRSLQLGAFPATVALILLGLTIKADGLFGDPRTMICLSVGSVLGLGAGYAVVLLRRPSRQNNGG